jgi:hypothetical protein
MLDAYAIERWEVAIWIDAPQCSEPQSGIFADYSSLYGVIGVKFCGCKAVTGGPLVTREKRTHGKERASR